MTEVMHKSRQDDALLILLVEGEFFTRESRDLMHFVMSTEGVHLHVTEVGSATTVLEPIVSCSGENIVIWSELRNILESLHRGLIYKRPAVARQRHRTVHDVMQLNLLGRGNVSTYLHALLLLKNDVAGCGIIGSLTLSLEYV